MRAWLCAGLVVAALVTPGRVSAQTALTQRDARGQVTVAVTLVAPPQAGMPIRATVILDTHSVALDGVVFEQAVTLRTPEGADVAPAGVEGVTGSGHHRQAVVTFAPLAQPGAVHIVVKNVGGVAERSFVWEPAPAK
jgi:hypothetical protein